jgi:hypothetical protein
MGRHNRFGVKGLSLSADGRYDIDLCGYRINGKTPMRKRVRLARGLSEADAIAYARAYLSRFQLSLTMPRDMAGVKGPRGKGHVYFIAVGEYVKVGFTTSKLEVRLRAVDTHSPIAPRLLAAIDGTHATEREWHARLAEHRVRREWFRLAPCIDVLRDALGVVVEEAAE